MSTSALKSITPSPYQVMSDLIDATSHEILLLEGKDDTSIAPQSSFAFLWNRLDYYSDQVHFKQDEKLETQHDVSTKLRDVRTSNRLAMATMAIEICARAAYPITDTNSSVVGALFRPLIDCSAEQWEEFRSDMDKVHKRLQNDVSDDGSASAGVMGSEKVCSVEGSDDVMSPSIAGHITMKNLYESLKCQMEAMQALALLRSQLVELAPNAVISEQSNGGGKIPFINACDLIMEYAKTAEDIHERLNTVHLIISEDYFLPPVIMGNDETAITPVNALIESIDDLVVKEHFPLHNFQVQFLKLLKLWEKSYLSPPTLFKLGYFQYDEPSDARAILSTTPISPSATTNSAGQLSKKRRAVNKSNAPPEDGNESDDDQLPITIKDRGTPPRRGVWDQVTEAKSPLRTRGKRRRVSSPKISSRKSPRQIKEPQYNFDFDSDGDDVQSRSTAKTSKRVKYSDEEKKCLLEGVAKFGFHWQEIRSHYWTVYKVNNRTNVNLKDLHRTLMKKRS